MELRINQIKWERMMFPVRKCCTSIFCSSLIIVFLSITTCRAQPANGEQQDDLRLLRPQDLKACQNYVPRLQEIAKKLNLKETLTQMDGIISPSRVPVATSAAQQFYDNAGNISKFELAGKFSDIKKIYLDHATLPNTSIDYLKSVRQKIAESECEFKIFNAIVTRFETIVVRHPLIRYEGRNPQFNIDFGEEHLLFDGLYSALQIDINRAEQYINEKKVADQRCIPILTKLSIPVDIGNKIIVYIPSNISPSIRLVDFVCALDEKTDVKYIPSSEKSFSIIFAGLEVKFNEMLVDISSRSGPYAKDSEKNETKILTAIEQVNESNSGKFQKYRSYSESVSFISQILTAVK